MNLENDCNQFYEVKVDYSRFESVKTDFIKKFKQAELKVH